MTMINSVLTLIEQFLTETTQPNMCPQPAIKSVSNSYNYLTVWLPKASTGLA